MLAHRARDTAVATTQGDIHSRPLVTARPNPAAVSSKVLTGALLTLEEVADFLELASAPESQRWAARALAYTTVFDSPLDRMTGLVLAHAWVAATPSARLHR